MPLFLSVEGVRGRNGISPQFRCSVPICCKSICCGQGLIGAFSITPPRGLRLSELRFILLFFLKFKRRLWKIWRRDSKNWLSPFKITQEQKLSKFWEYSKNNQTLRNFTKFWMLYFEILWALSTTTLRLFNLLLCSFPSVLRDENCVISKIISEM